MTVDGVSAALYFFARVKILKATSIPDNAFYNCPQLIIKCNKNSYAEQFAKEFLDPRNCIWI